MGFKQGKEYGRWKVVVLKMMQEDLLQAYHSSEFAGHCRGEKFYNAVRAKYWWPDMDRELQDFEKRCEVCTVHKTQVW